MLPNLDAALRWAVTVPRLSQDTFGVVIALRPLLSRLGLYRDALALVDLVLASGGLSGSQQASLLRNKGVLLLQLGHIDRARNAWSEGLAVSRGGGDTEAEYKLLMNLGVYWRIAGDYRQSEQLLHDALLQSDAAGDTLFSALTRVQLSSTLEKQGRLREALARLEDFLVQAGSETAATDFSEARGFAHMNAAIILDQMDELRRAEQLLRDGLRIVLDLSHAELEARLRDTLGVVLTRSRDLTSASDELERALEIASAIENGEVEAWVLVDMARLHQVRHQYELALEELNDAEAAAAWRGGLPEVEAYIAVERAEIALMTGKPEHAIALVENPLGFAKERAYRELLADCLLTLSRAYQMLEDHDRSREHAALAKGVYQQMEHWRQREAEAVLTALGTSANS